MNKTAIITGITGQDGSYLAKFLLNLGYTVVGFSRTSKANSLTNLRYLGIAEKVIIQECNLLDLSDVQKKIKQYKPQEIYNLAAQSSVGVSFEQPIGTLNFNINSVLNILEAIKMLDKAIKFYQASSSEMFGKVEKLPISESNFFHPLSPYAISKASAHWITVNYREAYGLFTCCGILFNHESYLRRSNYFIKKVIQTAIAIKKGNQKELRVGNIDIKRDFGYSPKYVEAMWKMMQIEQPDDFIVCSGKSVSLRKIIYYVFDYLGLDKNQIIQDETLFRPTEIKDIFGDNHKAKTVLDWQYELSIEDLLDRLIAEEYANYALKSTSDYLKLVE